MKRTTIEGLIEGEARFHARKKEVREWEDIAQGIKLGLFQAENSSNSGAKDKRSLSELSLVKDEKLLKHEIRRLANKVARQEQPREQRRKQRQGPEEPPVNVEQLEQKTDLPDSAAVRRWRQNHVQAHYRTQAENMIGVTLGAPPAEVTKHLLKIARKLNDGLPQYRLSEKETVEVKKEFAFELLEDAGPSCIGLIEDAIGLPRNTCSNLAKPRNATERQWLSRGMRKIRALGKGFFLSLLFMLIATVLVYGNSILNMPNAAQHKLETGALAKEDHQGQIVDQHQPENVAVTNQDHQPGIIAGHQSGRPRAADHQMEYSKPAATRDHQPGIIAGHQHDRSQATA